MIMKRYICVSLRQKNELIGKDVLVYLIQIFANTISCFFIEC